MESYDKTIGSIEVVNGEVVSIERGQTEQGYVYKNFEAYSTGDGICYIPELVDTSYTRKDFVEDFGDLADEVFYTVDWQSPASYYDELLEDMENESERGHD